MANENLNLSKAAGLLKMSEKDYRRLSMPDIPRDTRKDSKTMEAPNAASFVHNVVVSVNTVDCEEEVDDKSGGHDLQSNAGGAMIMALNSNETMSALQATRLFGKPLWLCKPLYLQFLGKLQWVRC